MRQNLLLAVAMATPLIHAQAITFCTDDECANCPGAVTTAGAGVKDDCVVYDTQTVFGGQGFEEGDGEFLFKAFADFSEPCGGDAGALMIRTPATLTDLYCGDLSTYSTHARCGASAIDLKETFMVQFCCGADDCTDAGVPFQRRSLGQRAGAGASGGLYLTYPNGTVIEPLVTGKPKRSAPTMKRCDGYKDDSYVAAGDWYVRTFNTQKISNTFPAEEEERDVVITYAQSATTSTSFDVTVGDPLGIISASVGFEFSNTQTDSLAYTFTIPADESGYVGFTPAYQCTTGTLTDCNGVVTPEGESCTPWVINGVLQGDYLLVQGQ